MATNINADNGVVSGSAGLKTSADSSGVLALQTNGTNAVTVDTSQNVGIATTSPAVKLHVATGGFQYGSASDYLRLVQTNTNEFGFLCNPLGNYSFNFNTSTGGIKVLNTLGVGDATSSTSGAGITFPATQSASSNANTLDDYEEGTWTPTVLGSISAGTGTYTHQVGTYVKVGQMVCASALITITNHTGSGNLLFGGLPFNTSNTNSLNRIGVTIGGCNNLALNASYVALAKAASNETVIYATQYPVGGGAEIDVALDTSFQIVFTITYRST